MTSISSHSTKLAPRLISEQFHQMLVDLDPGEFTLFHLTTTYLPYQDTTYTDKVINQFFTKFYLRTLLPELFHTRKWSTTKRLKQPLLLGFVDEHEQRPVQINSNHDHPIYDYPIRLHHHSIIASRNCTTEFFMDQVGDNTFNRYSPKFMTTNLKQCDADRIFYASKMLWKYPDHLVFGKR